MRVKLNIEYGADADRDGETAEDEQKVLDAIERRISAFTDGLIADAKAEGLDVSVSR